MPLGVSAFLEDGRVSSVTQLKHSAYQLQQGSLEPEMKKMAEIVFELCRVCSDLETAVKEARDDTKKHVETRVVNDHRPTDRHRQAHQSAGGR